MLREYKAEIDKLRRMLENAHLGADQVEADAELGAQMVEEEGEDEDEEDESLESVSAEQSTRRGSRTGGKELKTR